MIKKVLIGKKAVVGIFLEILVEKEDFKLQVILAIISII